MGMREMGWECGCGESAWECGESEWKYEKYGESRWELKYSGTWNSNGNDKLKYWREFKIINLVSHT